MRIIFLTDPLESIYSSLRPPFLIARELGSKGYDIIFTSPYVSEDVNKELRSYNFNVMNLGKHYLLSGSLLTFEAWLRRSELRLGNADDVVVNFSQCFLADAHIYYAQGPITRAIDDMRPELKWIYRFAYRLARPLLVKRDKGFNQEIRKRSRLFIANSRFCASMYRGWGIRVDGIIYPPLDCSQFKPTTSTPSQDYVLTYLGKETKHSILKSIANAGVRIKAFGSKTPYIPSYLLNHPNVEFLGHVSDEELIDLYSNALFTLLTFTHEPFGYIPVESMACGTPVLTYNKQGPSETVVNGVTGWLANGDDELVELAVRLWRDGYPSWMRSRCRERALEFDVKAVAERWLEVINTLLTGKATWHVE